MYVTVNTVLFEQAASEERRLGKAAAILCRYILQTSNNLKKFHCHPLQNIFSQTTFLYQKYCINLLHALLTENFSYNKNADSSSYSSKKKVIESMDNVLKFTPKNDH